MGNTVNEETNTKNIRDVVVDAHYIPTAVIKHQRSLCCRLQYSYRLENSVHLRVLQRRESQLKYVLRGQF